MGRGTPVLLSRPLVAVTVGAVLLVILGGILLAAGLWLFPEDPRASAAWTVGLGLVLLLGAALAALLFPRPSEREGAECAGPAAAEAVSRRTVSSPALAIAASEPVPETPVGWPSGAVEAPPPSSRPISTSIPGAYLAAVDSLAREEHRALNDGPPPIAAALPFAALHRPAASRASEEATETSAVLEVELARLRARLRELEVKEPPSVAVGARLAVSGGARGPIGAQPALEIGGARLSPTPLPRGCAGCGTAVPSAGTPALCASCGQLLCSSCAGKASAAGGPLFCPTCAARRNGEGSVSISGGRNGPISSRGGGA